MGALLRGAVIVLFAGLLAGSGAWRAGAAPGQDPGATDTTGGTDTTAPPTDPPSTDLTVVPPSDPPPTEPPPTEPPPTDPPPPPADQGDGDAGDDSVASGAVPPDAQRVINSVSRTPPGSNQALVDGVAALVAAGMPHDEAVAAVFGSFPILGPSHWVDDWLYPRWTGPTFRYHLGLDMFAAHGTPVAAPGHGVAHITDSALGGLSVRVVQPDGTYYYLAHLSAVPEGLASGDAVTTGQVVGFVGDSGNARGGSPHLHFAIHPHGGGPVPPKPIVDRWVAEGAARVPLALASITPPTQPGALAANAATRRLAAGVVAGDSLTPAGPPRTELLWASSANPTAGGLHLAQASAVALAETVDWESRALEQQALDLAWGQSAARAWRVLGPLTSPALRLASEGRR